MPTHPVRVQIVTNSVRDVFAIAIGVLTVYSTPDSLQQAGVAGALSLVWSAMLIVGAATSLVGKATHHDTLRIYGAVFVAGGFLIWTWSALSRPDPTTTSVAVALVFATCSLSQIQRAIWVALASDVHA